METSRLGWGGIWMRLQFVCLPVCLRTSLCVFYHSRDAAVWCDGLGPSAASHTTHALHYSNSISIRPPNKSSVRASRCDMLLASDLQPCFRKWDIQLLYHGCKTWYGCTHTQTHTLKQRRKVHDVNSHKKGTQRYKPIPLHTCPPQNPHIHSCFEWKKALVTTIMPKMIKKDTTHRGEKNSIVPIQSNL